MVLSLKFVIDQIQNWNKLQQRQVLGEPQAGVLVPFFEKNDKVYLILTLRSKKLNKHSGQISFPGGKIDASDSNIIETAIRETEEEIGISAANIEIICKFDDFSTPYYKSVTPVISRISTPRSYKKSVDEIDEILEIPFEDLLHPEIHRKENWTIEGTIYEVHFYEWQKNNG